MEALTSNRRTLLWRGLLLIAGALGLASAERRAGVTTGGGEAATRTGEPSLRGANPVTLTFYGRGWRPQTSRLARRADRDHVVGQGDLLDAADGVVVGRFCTNGFCGEAPFGHALAASPAIELQTLELDDGTVFGIGATPLSSGAEQHYAVIGGTGRFAGVRGTYAALTTSGGPEDRDIVEFILTLTT